jgi:hypothetical protein
MGGEIVHDPYTALALAVIYHAVQDLHCKNPSRVAEARAWLQFVGLDWCQLLGVTEEKLNAWVTGNFTLPPSAHRNWRY